jgi:hypothetical protein
MKMIFNYTTRHAVVKTREPGPPRRGIYGKYRTAAECGSPVFPLTGPLPRPERGAGAQ